MLPASRIPNVTVMNHSICTLLTVICRMQTAYNKISDDDSVYHRYLADDVHSDCSKLLLHGNLGLTISERPESLQKVVHTLVEGWNETFEVAIIKIKRITNYVLGIGDCL